MPDTACSSPESSFSDQSWSLSCAGAPVPSCCKKAGIRRWFSTAQRIGGTSWWHLWKIPLQIGMSVTTGLEDDVSVAVLRLMFRTCMETINPDSIPHIPPTPVLPPTHTLSREVQKLWELMMWVESAALNVSTQSWIQISWNPVCFFPKPSTSYQCPALSAIKPGGLLVLAVPSAPALWAHPEQYHGF